MSSFLQDLWFAARASARHRQVTILAVLCLALGVGLNATIFSVVNGILFRPFPFAAPSELVALRQTFPERQVTDNEVSWPDFLEWERTASSAASMGAYFNRGFSLGRIDDLTQIDGASVSAGLLPTLGVPAAMGRHFLASEAAPGAPNVVILAHDLWQERYEGRREVLGTDISVNGRPHTVVGVMPAGFRFPDQARLWTPIALDPAAERGNRYMEAIARLRPGRSAGQLEAELTAASDRMAREHPETNRGWGADVADLRDHEVGSRKPALAVLQAAVLLVLLIACANVANLLLARGVAREKELAVRASLGARRGRLMRQMLLESVLIALAGGALGAAMAVWGVAALTALLPPVLPFWLHFSLDARVLAFVLSISLLAALAAGLHPAVRLSRVDVHAVLKNEGRSGSASRGTRRSRHVLVVAEMAFAVMLLVAATLMVRSFVTMTRTSPGFAVDGRLTAFLSFRDPRYDSAVTRTRAMGDILTALRALPGVRAAATVDNVPLNGNSSSMGLYTDRDAVEPGKARPAEYRIVSPGYFETMGIPVHRGRAFIAPDVADGGRRVVVGETLAERFFPGEDPVGRSVRFLDTLFQIVGVVGDSRLREFNLPPAPQLFVLYSDLPRRGTQVVLETAGDPYAMIPAMRRAIAQAAPAVPVFREATLREVVGQSMWAERIMGVLLSAFGFMALLLTAFGVYGVIAYTVSQRRREIGVRMALGAQRGSVLRLVVGGSLWLGALGTGLGLAGALATSGALRAMLFGVSPTDPRVLATVAMALLAIAVLAAWVPARRAAGLDPAIALRED